MKEKYENGSLIAFDELPRRIFLDSSTLQTLQDYGEFIYDNCPPPETDRIYSIPDGFANIDALRAIMFVNQRANFEFALSHNSLDEVLARGDLDYLIWARDVLDYWESCLGSYYPSPFSGVSNGIARKLECPSFGYLSNKDRILLRDAITLECQAFLTMERRLPKNRHHIKEHLGLLVLQPIDYWSLLEPWARLYT
jgi:hypothetical protein